MKIKQADGTEIEVFTPQEVEVKTKEATEAAAKKAVDDYKAQNPDKSGEVTRLQKEKDDAEKKLREALDGGGDNDSPQIKRLRQERDDANKKLTEVIDGFKKDFETFKGQVVGDQKKQLLDKLSKGDAELRKKIEFEFDNYRPNDIAPDAILARAEKAYQLATGNKPTPNMFDSITGGASQRGNGSSGGEPTKVTENAKAIGNALGITDADREKFGKK